MTREEAAKIINECKNEGLKYTLYTKEDYHMALDMAIKALEQQPCEDTISRQAVLDFVNADWKYEGLEVPINNLPPVTPQPKMGRWIEHFDESGKWYECDQCHTDWGGSVNFCPNCGATMQEVE